jgi:hypothetical protein
MQGWRSPVVDVRLPAIVLAKASVARIAGGSECIMKRLGGLA